jgi:RHS repeat-associated protein
VEDGNRITATGQTDQQVTRFVWQGLQLVQEQNAANLSSYVYEPGSYTPLARLDQTINADGSVSKGRLYYFHGDQIGTPQEVTDETGKLVWAGHYSAWGRLERDDLDVVETGVPFTQNLRFAGQYADESTGLHYNTFRYYDPDVGRFTSQDPIGLDGGLNLYQYAPNPTGWIDPWGLACGDTLPNPVSFNRGNRNFHLEQGNASSGWKHIYDRHIDPARFPGKSKFDPSMNHDDLNGLLGKTLKHGQESQYAGKSVFEARLKFNGKYNRYRATVNADGSVQTFHPLD